MIEPSSAISAEPGRRGPRRLIGKPNWDALRLGVRGRLYAAFAGISFELGNAWDDRADIALDGAIWGGSLWTGVDTPLGPVYLGYGVAEGGLSSFYVFLGRAF